jgi:hypothetical protein
MGFLGIEMGWPCRYVGWEREGARGSELCVHEIMELWIVDVG